MPWPTSRVMLTDAMLSCLPIARDIESFCPRICAMVFLAGCPRTSGLAGLDVG